MNIDILLTELQFKASKSSGPGGQHVNKTASKVELSFNINTSQALSLAQKQLLLVRLKSRLTNNDILILQCNDGRSQHKNKKIVISRFINLLNENLKVKKPRKKTAPSKNAIERRLKLKKNNALKKATRKPPKID